MYAETVQNIAQMLQRATNWYFGDVLDNGPSTLVWFKQPRCSRFHYEVLGWSSGHESVVCWEQQWFRSCLFFVKNYLRLRDTYRRCWSVHKGQIWCQTGKDCQCKLEPSESRDHTSPQLLFSRQTLGVVGRDLGSISRALAILETVTTVVNCMLERLAIGSSVRSEMCCTVCRPRLVRVALKQNNIGPVKNYYTFRVKRSCGNHRGTETVLGKGQGKV